MPLGDNAASSQFFSQDAPPSTQVHSQDATPSMQEPVQIPEYPGLMSTMSTTMLLQMMEQVSS